MRILRILCLAVVACGVCMLAAKAAEQTKPAPAPNKVVIPPQVTPATQNKPGAATAPSRANLPPATDERNKATVHRVFEDLFSHGRYEAISQIYMPDCIVHYGGKNSRLEESVAEGKGWRMAAPDMHMTAESLTINGDFVTVNWTAQGTHTGHGNGLQPSGKRFLVHGNSRFRMVNGKIAEVWNNYSRDDLFRQLGVSPKVGNLYIMTQEFVLAVNRFFSAE
jgi:predicted ester cyclase